VWGRPPQAQRGRAGGQKLLGWGIATPSGCSADPQRTPARHSGDRRTLGTSIPSGKHPAPHRPYRTRADRPLSHIKLPPATAAIVAILLLGFGLTLALPQPAWLAEPWAAPARTLTHANVIHTVLTAVALGVAGRLHERRFGSIATAILVASGAVGSILGVQLFDGQLLVGASGGALALCGALLIDLARRQASASLFGPLVAPMLLHGAIDAFVPGDYGLLHGIGLLVGVLLSRLGKARSS
jgi:membrane associated rhomboid family serine protease